MVSLSNRFYRGVVHSNDQQPHPNFKFILVDTVRELQNENGEWYTDSFMYYEDFLLHDPDKGEVFYGVYGSYWSDIPKSYIKILETNNLKEAINIAQEIMGATIVETKIDYNA